MRSDFLFFNDCSVLKELSLLSDKEPRVCTDLIHRLVLFASEFGLSGNIWHHWLTYTLMTHENAFTLTAERQKLVPESTLLQLAQPDFEKFRELYAKEFCLENHREFALLEDYKPPFDGYEMNTAGKMIMVLSNKLSQAKDLRTFIFHLTEFYAQYGVGLFGMYKAFRISEEDREIRLVPVTDDADVSFEDLIGLEEQKWKLRENTEAFLNGIHANNVLLYGDSGTGKSTSVHALIHDYYDKGLRLVELSKQNRKLLPQVLAAIKKRNYRFIIFLDDLSFEENESEYKELKAMLEGALEKRADRVLIYATSNRRHLIRETWKDRNDMEYQDDIHHSDTMEEKLSLASRFGVTIYYSKPEPAEYLRIVRELADKRGLEISEKELLDNARKWELRHGGMSGRTASQFIIWMQAQLSRQQTSPDHRSAKG